ncbi:MAG: aminotransferase class IV [Fibrobacterota bacterium]
MCLLIETVRLVDGVPVNAHGHNARIKRAVCELGKEKVSVFDVGAVIDPPEDLKSGRVKCRILFGRNITGIEYRTYTPRKIKSLKVVYCDDIVYDHKYADRRVLEALRGGRGEYDEVLIVRSGYVTDTSFSNVVFFSGNKYYTPSCPLLYGTRRRQLIDSGELREEEIKASEIRLFDGIFLINSMLDPFEIRIDRSAVIL